MGDIIKPPEKGIIERSCCDYGLKPRETKFFFPHKAQKRM